MDAFKLWNSYHLLNCHLLYSQLQFLWDTVQCKILLLSDGLAVHVGGESLCHVDLCRLAAVEMYPCAGHMKSENA